MKISSIQTTASGIEVVSSNRPVKGLVNHILPHSFVDGPGNRMVIFLQGCNMNCLYCHNPYTIQLCNNCGDCIKTCPSHALSLQNGKVLWLMDKCLECDTCNNTCPSQSSPKVKEYLPEKLWEKVKASTRFVSGVSVSGGEPMLQVAFLVRFFQLVKDNSKLSTLIETNGFVGPNAYIPLLPFLDMALVDLKSIQPDMHSKLTGKPLETILDSIAYLRDQRKLLAVQQVIVPGFSDTIEQIHFTARFLVQIDPMIPLRLLRFRPHGTHGESRTWTSPTEKCMDDLVRAAREEGLQTVTRSI